MTSDQRIARIAARQHGLFTNPQALAAGLSATAIADRLRAGRLHRLEPQVYRIAGAPDSWHQRLMAACLAENGVASHRAAASLFDLDGFPPRVVEVTVHRWERRVNCSLRVHESTDLADTHRSERRGIPVTTIERTLIDLGAVVPRIRVEHAFDDALQRRLTTPSRCTTDSSLSPVEVDEASVSSARSSSVVWGRRDHGPKSSNAEWHACSWPAVSLSQRSSTRSGYRAVGSSRGSNSPTRRPS